ncbi:MAG: lytic transglycosylase domain-containing protein [Bacillota bacterium]|nr:lytic transglycosylase domain-containing protein [Bacillota bacterium]
MTKQYSKKKKNSGVKQFFIVFFVLLTLAFVVVHLFSDSERAYPRPYSYLVEYYCEDYGVDSNLVYSIMKQESGFDPDARSHKGAAGLMQVMPETAQWSTSKMGIEYREDELTDPSYNLNISIWYLSYLNGVFGGNTVEIIAAYNGGEGNVETWLSNGTWDGTVENASDIPFGETSRYVENVSANLQKYQEIYGKN